MKSKFLIIFLLLSFFICSNANALPTKIFHLGDTTVEAVQQDGLTTWFDQNGITAKDGDAVDILADQMQHEIFYTDTGRDYIIEFLGIGNAGFHSPFGVFTYEGDFFEGYDSDLMTFHDPLFVQNEVEPDTTYSFSVSAGTYFGFYLNSNGGGTYLTTLVNANPKPTSNKVVNKDDYTNGLDHALFYETNKGITITFEDIIGGGDYDFEDLVVNFSPADGSGFTPVTPVPEPATLVLFGIGLFGMGVFFRKTSGKK